MSSANFLYRFTLSHDVAESPVRDVDVDAHGTRKIAARYISDFVERVVWASLPTFVKGNGGFPIKSPRVTKTRRDYVGEWVTGRLMVPSLRRDFEQDFVMSVTIYRANGHGFTMNVLLTVCWNEQCALVGMSVRGGEVL